ncbi:MAG: CocE/NonD family hydrolase [Mycobacteriaceae bacterium]
MRFVNKVLVLLAGVALAISLLVSPTSAEPQGGQDGAEWTQAHDAEPEFPGMHIDWDVPITMSDGVVIKANVYRPADATGAPIDESFPTILNLTPYTKLVSNIADTALNIPVLSDLLVNFVDSMNLSGTPLSGVGEVLQVLSGGGLRTFTVDPALIRSGYTQVVADVRGTGFSQGVWNVLQDREQQDTIELIDWASSQPWSNGDLGMTGVSYSAINQIQAAAQHPKALKAIFPVEPSSDLMHDVVAPGGGLGVGFMPLWLSAVNGLKLVPDLQSMFQGNFDWQWLMDRFDDPLTFMDRFFQALTVPDVNSVPAGLNDLLDDKSSIRDDLVLHPEKISIPTMVYGGWHDIFTNSEPKIYNAIPVPAGQKQLIMGNTYHLNFGTGFGKQGTPPRLDIMQRAWFDRWLKGIDNNIESFGPVTSYQQGQGWTTTDQFPRSGMHYQRLYFSSQGSGTTSTSVYDGSLKTSADNEMSNLTIAPNLSTICSRDSAQQTMGITAIIAACGTDSQISETGALTFTSAPVDSATEISGALNVHLNTVHEANDGYWSVTLNDVAPDGTSTVLTSGQLASSLRDFDEKKTLRSPQGDVLDPYYFLTLDSRKPVDIGVPTTLEVGLTATDAVLQAGHRLRVDIYASNFPKGLLLRPLLNDSGLKPQHLLLDLQAPSFITLPVGRKIV